MEFTLPKIIENDYGRIWPNGTPQHIKELSGFRSNGGEGYDTRLRHGLRLVRMLWPDQVSLYKKVVHYKTGETVIVWNSFFMRTFRACCENKRLALTGCSSSGKTFGVSVYALLLFMSNPKNSTIMISTTSGSDSERRVWGEIKDLHNALPDEARVGTLIDYLKVITFDPGKELMGSRDVRERDIGSGVMLIPIPDGSEGEKALGKIIGTKQKDGFVVWIIDELPNMMEGVLRGESNLLSNPWFQCIGIGNAKAKTDPHGAMCEPMDGWQSVNESMDEWDGKSGTKVLFFHGERSPNYHPAVDPNLPDRGGLPFPYLSNRIFVREVAGLNGRGDEDLGRQTIDFLRFAIGFWPGDSVSNVIVSEQMVRSKKADNLNVSWGQEPLKKVAGFDPAWTSGGDSCELSVGTIGKENGKMIVLCQKDTIRFISRVKGSGEEKNEEFRRDISNQVVDYCRENKILPENFGMDTSGDGALMYREIVRAWGSSEVVAISSMEKARNPKYKDRVTQYWYQCADAILSGSVKGFSLSSRYFRDLSRRTYNAIGLGIVKVEKKSDFKKRFKYSPDCGDAFSYMMEMAVRNGLEISWHLDHESRAVKNIIKFDPSQSTEGVDYCDNQEVAYR